MAGEIIVWVRRISVFVFCFRYFTHLGPREGRKRFFWPFAPPYGTYLGLIFRSDNADRPHPHLSSHAASLFPACEPLGQITGTPQTAETAIYGVLIAPHHPDPGATCHARLDVITVKPQITLNIETVGAASHRAVGVDQAGSRRQVQQRTYDGAR